MIPTTSHPRNDVSEVPGEMPGTWDTGADGNGMAAGSLCSRRLHLVQPATGNIPPDKHTGATRVQSAKG